ncbi:porin family protein [Paraflavitalea sp. CAU 1676]|uniref:porin family protein n=1 Tax=Paraflavitalea sp. CAU 1676 TaxID=3032598 RepID=UPI0023DBA87B|nr:porin family protein [Paraflavitalea sp. CAU 1676]MDF2190289.1 porin family protein [Paraflavitalea sp. CAU 1676]
MKNATSSLKRILLLAAFTGTLSAAMAQQQQTTTEKSLQPKFGIKGGVNLSNLYVDDVEDENMKVGVNVGVFAKIPVTKGFSVQPELLYSSKGAKIKYDNLFGEGEYRFNLNYVELPVLAVVNLGNNFNIHAGPYVSLLTSANIKRLNAEDGEVDDIADLDTDNFKRFDYGLVGGIGFDIENFTLGARYNYGLNEIGDGGVAGQATKNSKNSAFTFYIGIGF